MSGSIETENEALRAMVARLSAALAKSQSQQELASPRSRDGESDDSDREATMEDTLESTTVEEPSVIAPLRDVDAEPTGASVRKMSSTNRSCSWRDPPPAIVVMEPPRPSLMSSSSVAMVAHQAIERMRRGSRELSSLGSSVADSPTRRRLSRGPSSLLSRSTGGEAGAESPETHSQRLERERTFEKRLERLRREGSNDSTGSCTKVLRGLARSRSDTTLGFALAPRPSAAELAAASEPTSRKRSGRKHDERSSPGRLRHGHAGGRLAVGSLRRPCTAAFTLAHRRLLFRTFAHRLLPSLPLPRSRRGSKGGRAAAAGSDTEGEGERRTRRPNGLSVAVLARTVRHHGQSAALVAPQLATRGS